jgi:hypothetical protein
MAPLYENQICNRLAKKDMLATTKVDKYKKSCVYVRMIKATGRQGISTKRDRKKKKKGIIELQGK